MRAAAAVLAAATTTEGLRAVVRAAGVCGESVPLDLGAFAGLGVDGTTAGELIAGVGEIRVLLLSGIPPETSLREYLQRLSRRLASRAPHVLWLVTAVDSRAMHAGLVTISATAGPRISAFLWEPARVVDSDAETLCALAAVRGTAGPRISAFLWEPARVVDSDAETLCALA